MESRPHIRLQLSPLDKMIEQISIVMLIVLWAFTVYSLIVLPYTIPIHFDFSGKPDSYGSKFTLLFLPLLVSLVYTGLTWLNKHPYLFNYPTKITEENAAKQYTIATRMLRFLKLAVLVIFTWLAVSIYFIVKGSILNLGAWFLPVTLVLVFLPVVLSIVLSVKRK